MKTYTVQLIVNEMQMPWRAFAGAFEVFAFETSDRRVARKVVRLARKLGYMVKF